MGLEVAPEPTPDERKALERALARLLEEPLEPRSLWWREGIREDLSSREDEPV